MLWLLLEHALKKVLSLIGDLSPVLWVEFKLLLEDPLEDLLVVVTLERRVTAEHDIENNS